MRVDIQVQGDVLFSRDLLRFAGVASNMAPVWDSVEEAMTKAFERNFSEQGPGWAPLKPSTIRSRIAQGYAPGPILTRSGDFRRTMTTELVTHTSQNEMTVVAPAVPGLFHQMGTKRMAARPLRFTENERQDIVRIIQRYLIESMS